MDGTQQQLGDCETVVVNDLILVACLTGIPPDQVKLHPLACSPDTPLTELGIICRSCLGSTSLLLNFPLAQLPLGLRNPEKFKVPVEVHFPQKPSPQWLQRDGGRGDGTE